MNWDVADLETALQAGGFEPEQVHVERHDEGRTLTAEHLARWFDADTVDDGRPSYAARLQAAGLGGEALEGVSSRYRRQLQGATVTWESATVYVVAVSRR